MGCITKLLKSGLKNTTKNPASSYVEGGGLYEGYEYLTILTPLGYRCGYVAIPEEHPLYKEKDYNGVVGELEVHGGVTFFDKQLTDSDCKDKWIGFDCAHFSDMPDIEAAKLAFKDSPGHIECLNLHKNSFFNYKSIKTKEFAEDECKSIIDQLVSKYPQKKGGFNAYKG